MCRPGLPGLETVEQLQYLVLSMCRQRVSTSVHRDAGASWEVVIEPHVGGPWMVKLNVPIAERWYFPVDLVTQCDLRECRAVRRRRPYREQL